MTGYEERLYRGYEPFADGKHSDYGNMSLWLLLMAGLLELSCCRWKEPGTKMRAKGFWQFLVCPTKLCDIQPVFFMVHSINPEKNVVG